jgi:hypothetical protein
VGALVKTESDERKKSDIVLDRAKGSERGIDGIGWRVHYNSRPSSDVGIREMNWISKKLKEINVPK